MIPTTPPPPPPKRAHDSAPRPATQQIVIEDSRGAPENEAHKMDAARIRTAIYNAEHGIVDDLWALYQGVIAGDPWIQGLLATRKLACLQQPITCEPEDEKNQNDVAAASEIENLLYSVKKFRRTAIAHLLDSILRPVAITEKVYRPDATRPGRYTLDRIVPVYHHLEDYRQGTLKLRNQLPLDGSALDSTYEIDQYRHIVHRGNILTVPDNWGGPFRSLLMLWLLRTCNREWWARNAERWGSPIPVGKYPSGDLDAKRQLKNAFENFLRLGGLVVSDQTAIEMVQANASGSTDAFERLQKWAESQIQILIVGQELSSSAEATGMGSGVASLQGQVRDDLAQLDTTLLGETLNEDLARPHLAINGFVGSARIKIGASTDYRMAAALSEIMPGLAAIGVGPTDEGLDVLSSAIGVPLQRVERALSQGAQPGGVQFSTLSGLNNARSPSALRAAIAAIIREQ